ncbi:MULTISPECIES: MoaD/ThiS family protein [Arthrobacter]|uniref:MoaD/ThiS family protein n=2 Tax=Arthrobacter TaxID=1663 RepID=A0ABU9KKQ5_9MICC|nr:MoaD/ThiS family protein [Arthrobacter sp. YJM1]MDP5226823.1 MoaD/ThiS family protein [Arthrobacter sp. YJM1]
MPVVSVVVPSVLRPLVQDAGSVRVELPGQGTVTVGQVLGSLAGSHPLLGRRLRDETGALRRHVNVYLGPDEVRRLQGLDTPVPDGAELLIIQSVAGG